MGSLAVVTSKIGFLATASLIAGAVFVVSVGSAKGLLCTTALPKYGQLPVEL
jgi:hypothetical protein